VGHSADAADNLVRILRTGVVGFQLEHEMGGVYDVKRLEDLKQPMNVALNQMRTWRMLKKS
jgi:hypothetical protein